MSKSKSFLWRKFDKVERTVGEPLEELVASKTYTDVLLAVQKVRSKIGGAVANSASGAVERVLHIAQIPTRSDVRRLNRQIVELATEVRSLSTRLQEHEPVATPRKATAKRQRVRATAAPGKSKAKKARGAAVSARAKQTKAVPKNRRKVVDGK